MPRHNDSIRLRHMLDASSKAVKYLRRRTRKDLNTDEQLALSLTRLLEIIGEAAGKVSQEGQITSSKIPWPKIIGMRNRLIHAYFDVDLNEVWRTVQEDLPPLIAELKKIVG